MFGREEWRWRFAEMAAMESVGVVEAKRRFSELVERGTKGERIQITKRGVPVAVLGPLPTTAERSARAAREAGVEVVGGIEGLSFERRRGGMATRQAPTGLPWRRRAEACGLKMSWGGFC